MTIYIHIYIRLPEKIFCTFYVYTVLHFCIDVTIYMAELLKILNVHVKHGDTERM